MYFYVSFKLPCCCCFRQMCLSVLYCCLSIGLLIILLSFCVLFNVPSVGMFLFVYCPVSFFYGLCFLFIWMCTFSLSLFLSLPHFFKDQCGFLAFCLIHHFCLPRLCLEFRQSHTILKRDVTESRCYVRLALLRQFKSD